MLSAEQITQIADIFNYLFIRQKDVININPLLTRNPLPVIEVSGKKLYGSADGLTDITYGQYAMLTAYFHEMERQPEAINDFIAMIYHRDGEDKGQANDIKKIPTLYKMLIMWYYIGCLDFIANKFPRVFSGGGEKSNLTPFENQMRIIDMLADNDVTRKEAVQNSKLYDCLYTMDIAIENAEKMEKTSPKK